MVMETMQIRMNEQLVRELDKVVKSGFYANRADAIRDAVRRFIWNREVGSIKNTGNSVREVRKIRKILSEKIKTQKDFDEINNF
jgi:Arc/MetJ-type ribon-helix-helix transcriptional regulator